MKHIEEKVIIPTEDRNTAVSEEHADFIYNFLKTTGLRKTLEVGFAYGYSAAHIMEATQAIHVVIDPYQEKNYHNLGKQNIRALGLIENLRLYESRAHEALPKIISLGERFNFVFIDGGHKFDQTFVDWYFSDLLLESQGYILFHDAWMPSIQCVSEFIRKNRLDYEEINIEIPDMTLFKKVGIDRRHWQHFVTF